MFLVLDTETGGIGYKEHSLLSAGFFVVDEHLTIMDSLNLFLVPDNRIIHVTPKALTVNKIDLVKHDEAAMTYTEGRKIMETFLKKWGEKEKLEPVGWGVYFDILTIKEHLTKDRLWNRYVSYRTLDLCSVSRFLKLCGAISIAGGLQKTADFLIGPSKMLFGEAHTAMGDAHRTLEVFRYLVSAGTLRSAVSEGSGQAG